MDFIFITNIILSIVFTSSRIYLQKSQFHLRSLSNKSNLGESGK